jgi:hypothetical protein
MNSRFYNYTFYEPSNHRNYITLDVDHLKFPIGIRGQYPIHNKITPFINFGMMNNLKIADKSNLFAEENNGTLTYYNEDIKAFNNLGIGFWYGIGTFIRMNNKYSLSIEYKNEMDGSSHFKTVSTARLTSDFDARIINSQLLIGIKF